MVKTKASNAIDAHVGSRVRMRRMMLGMSQEKLGDALGLTFSRCKNTKRARTEWGQADCSRLPIFLASRCHSFSKEPWRHL